MPAPRETREEIARLLKTKFPHTKILALNPPQQPNLVGAVCIDYALAFQAARGSETVGGFLAGGHADLLSLFCSARSTLSARIVASSSPHSAAQSLEQKNV